MNIFNLPKSEEEAVQFLQENGILMDIMLCENGHQMKLYFGQNIFWACMKSQCRKKINIRTGTWFDGTRLSFVTAIRFWYCWAKELTSIKWCQEELDISAHTTIEWNAYMRATCAKFLMKQEMQKIGGPGKIVEIDESLFSKRKSNVGRVLPQQWIFGGLCRETNQCFLVQIPDRSAATLMKAVLEHIEEGSIIYSDSWRSYKTEELNLAGFEHFKVNHRYNFIDPITGVHTQHIERLWGSAKWRNKRQRGTSRSNLDMYLAEFMWRNNVVVDNIFDMWLKTVKSLM